MLKYCESIYRTSRRKTRQVLVGDVGIGAQNPVRIQSMTTSDTKDVSATVEQILRLADSGCEIVRVTVQGMQEAKSCEEIKNTLIRKGYTIPLVADIHFFPAAALHVADFVEKIRINPGNYADKRASFKQITYDDASYLLELEKLEEKFSPLVDKCKKLNRAMRIGTNHGSLSDRIMNRYGDTPQGMLESALEFASICRKNDYHNFLFSMKASNPRIMIQAYRLLVAQMIELDWDYPLHLGVTEAGEGEDGRIKSAMGIGALLLDGIGDTIRVSLTEDAWKEIDPCKRLVCLAKTYENGSGVSPFIETYRDPMQIVRRKVSFPSDINMHKDGTVALSITPTELKQSDFYHKIGCGTDPSYPKLQKDSADLLILKQPLLDPALQDKLSRLKEIGITTLTEDICIVNEDTQNLRSLLCTHPPSVIFLAPQKNRIHFCRSFFEFLQNHQLQIPVILHFSYECPLEDLLIQAAAEYGSLLCDGLGEGILIGGDYPLELLKNVSFQILQAARLRTFKTEFISCPSCGRTLFNLQEVSKKIREKTSHLPGVKIAIMGCIVNGPGEMADADFGYVGSKPGMIDLYVGKECVEKGIRFSDAEDRLMALIKQHGRWIDAPV